MDNVIVIDGREVVRFHPLHKKIKDGIPRCIACGQIDEPEYHDERFCPGRGGWIPVKDATLRLSLKAASGTRCKSEWRINHAQWVAINRILDGDDHIQRDIVDQHGHVVGEAKTPITEILSMEAHVDENGTVWTPPTAWAYFGVCRALIAKDKRICELLGKPKASEDAPFTDDVDPGSRDEVDHEH